MGRIVLEFLSPTSNHKICYPSAITNNLCAYIIMLLKHSSSPHDGLIKGSHDSSKELMSPTMTPELIQKMASIRTSNKIPAPSVYKKCDGAAKLSSKSQKPKLGSRQMKPERTTTFGNKHSIDEKHAASTASNIASSQFPDLFYSNIAKSSSPQKLAGVNTKTSTLRHSSTAISSSLQASASSPVKSQKAGASKSTGSHSFGPEFFMRNMTRQRSSSILSPVRPSNKVADYKSPVIHRSSIANSSTPSWMADGSFAKSKIYQARMYKAAVVVQKNARRFLQRDRIENERNAFFSTKIQSIVRRALKRIALKRGLAARYIQAHARGWHARRNRQVYVLEKRLADIEAQRFRELGEIRAWKRNQIDRLARRGNREAQKQKKVGEVLDKIETDFLVLRKENTKLRAQNEKLKQECSELTIENEKMERNLQAVNAGIDRLKRFIAATEKQIPQSLQIANMFLDRTRKARRNLKAYDEVIECESKVSHFHLEAISQMVNRVQSSANPDLGEEVMNIALLEA